MTVERSSKVGHRFNAAQARLGLFLFVVGLGVFLLAAWENSASLPVVLPGFWYHHRSFCLLVALVLIGVGWFVLTRGPRSFSPDAAPVWTAVRSGRRFHTATMYTRRNCLLCDEALEQLRAYRAYLPEVSVVDIDRDPELQRRFDTSVPVVELDGRIRFRGHVSDLLLRRLIDGTPPLRESQ